MRPFILSGIVLSALALAAQPSSAETDDYVREAVLTGPTDLVWELLTTESGIRSWLAPHAAVDLRVGGLVKTHQDPEGRLGDPQTAVSRVIALNPKKAFSFRLEKAPKGYPLASMIEGTWYGVALESLPGAKTKIRCKGNGLATGWMSSMVRPVFNQGVDMVFDHLQKAVTRRLDQDGGRNRGADAKSKS